MAHFCVALGSCLGSYHRICTSAVDCCMVRISVALVLCLSFYHRTCTGAVGCSVTRLCVVLGLCLVTYHRICTLPKIVVGPTFVWSVDSCPDSYLYRCRRRLYGTPLCGRWFVAGLYSPHLNRCHRLLYGCFRVAEILCLGSCHRICTGAVDCFYGMPLCGMWICVWAPITASEPEP